MVQSYSSCSLKFQTLRAFSDCEYNEIKKNHQKTHQQDCSDGCPLLFWGGQNMPAVVLIPLGWTGIISMAFTPPWWFWVSEEGGYELPDTPAADEQQPPKGWLHDFVYRELVKLWEAEGWKGLYKRKILLLLNQWSDKKRQLFKSLQQLELKRSGSPIWKNNNLKRIGGLEVAALLWILHGR